MRAIVVGGGIGGLCAAIALRRAGVEPAVFEQSPSLEEVGAGLSLWPNAVRPLDELGVDDAVRAVGVAARTGRLRSSRGRTLFEGSWDWLEPPGLAVHRADLQSVLLEALGADFVRLGSRCTGFSQGEEGVTAHFAEREDEHGDLLIGADGLHSEIRAQLFGRANPRYAGYTAWRGVARLDDAWMPPESWSESWGRGFRFGLLNIGGGHLYWFGVKGAPEGEPDAPGGRKREVLASFRGWHEPIEAVIEATEEPVILRNDIYDREPLDRWSEGRVTLLGDAAHPMTPDLGQGACQAIEDAVVLGDCLRDQHDVAASIRLYEARRLRRANAIVRESRRMGRIAQLRNPVAAGLRDLVMRATPARVQERLARKQYEWIMGCRA